MSREKMRRKTAYRWPNHTTHILEQSLAHSQSSKKYLLNEWINIGHSYHQILKSQLNWSTGCAFFPLCCHETWCLDLFPNIKSLVEFGYRKYQEVAKLKRALSPHLNQNIPQFFLVYRLDFPGFSKERILWIKPQKATGPQNLPILLIYLPSAQSHACLCPEWSDINFSTSFSSSPTPSYSYSKTFSTMAPDTPLIRVPGNIKPKYVHFWAPSKNYPGFLGGLWTPQNCS